MKLQTSGVLGTSYAIAKLAPKRAVFGQFYTIPITPFSILRDATGFGGSFMINFNGNVTIPK